MNLPAWATGGLVTSIIGTVLGIVIYLACVACMKTAQKGIVKELNKQGMDVNKLQQDMKKAIEEAKKRQKK